MRFPPLNLGTQEGTRLDVAWWLGGFGPSLESIIGASVVGEIQVVPEDHGVDDRFQQGSVELLPGERREDVTCLTNDTG